METSKLMIPLFYGHSFNRERHKRRMVYEREITDGKQAYQLWRGVGEADSMYPNAENDKYHLYVEINGYLAPLGMTDFFLIDRCGNQAMVENLYGGEEERVQHFSSLRTSGGDTAVHAALAEEKKEIERYGNAPAHQVEYICSFFNKKVNTYLKARENGGQTPPDFIGALILNELSRCTELSAVYQAKVRADEEARKACVAAEDKAYCDEQNRVAEQVVSAAIQTIRGGGVLKNTSITFYQNRYSSSSVSIINYLMRQFHVDVPLRTQGWINEKLFSVTIEDGKCEFLQYRRSKNGVCSQRFFQCMDDLIRAITAQKENAICV